ncbi:MAG: CopG family transcriptional regulator [Oscillospiraceae bacterium]|nr:CopG family transcriptional regulator [Oscillospiraceae bacterium]
MPISLRLNKEDEELIRDYSALHNISLSELVRQAVLEKIEDEYDLAAYEKAMKEYSEDPVTFTLDEVEKELGLE